MVSSNPNDDPNETAKDLGPLRSAINAIQTRVMGGLLLALPIVLTFWIIYWLYSTFKQVVHDPIVWGVRSLIGVERVDVPVGFWWDQVVAPFVAIILVLATLYFQAYYASDAERNSGAYQVSQIVWGLFLGLNVAFTYMSREAVRELLEHRWRAGIGLKRILIAGAGDLGRMLADRILQHRELGYQVVGFVDDRAGGDHLGYRGLPLLGKTQVWRRP